MYLDVYRYRCNCLASIQEQNIKGLERMKTYLLKEFGFKFSFVCSSSMMLTRMNLEEKNQCMKCLSAISLNRMSTSFSLPFSIPITALRMLGQMHSFFSLSLSLVRVFFFLIRCPPLSSSATTGKTRRQMVSTRSPLSIHSQEVAHTHAQCTMIGQREHKKRRETLI